MVSTPLPSPRRSPTDPPAWQDDSSRAIQRSALGILILVPLLLGFFFGTPLLASFFGAPLPVGPADTAAPVVRRPAPAPPSEPPAAPAVPPTLGSASATRPVASVGTVQQLAGMELTVREVQLTESASPSVRVYLLLALRNVGTNRMSYSPNYFSIVDGEGNVFTAYAGSTEASLDRSTLDGKASTEGWVAFDLPSGTENVMLLYYPLGAGARQTALAVDLGF